MAYIPRHKIPLCSKRAGISRADLLQDEAMLEGLWIVKFLSPEPEGMELGGGVAVIESGRLLGGDSGYSYVGSVQPAEPTGWTVELKISRHDDDIISVFGDEDEYVLVGGIARGEPSSKGAPQLIANLQSPGVPIKLVVQLTKAAELP